VPLATATASGGHHARTAAPQRHRHHERGGEGSEHGARRVVEGVPDRRDRGRRQIEGVAEQRIGVAVDDVGRHVAVGESAVQEEGRALGGGPADIDRPGRGHGDDAEQQRRGGYRVREQARQADSRMERGRRRGLAAGGRPPDAPTAQVRERRVARQDAEREQLTVTGQDRDREGEQGEHVEVADTSDRKRDRGERKPQREQGEQPGGVAQLGPEPGRARREDLGVLHPPLRVNRRHGALGPSKKVTRASRPSSAVTRERS
jgi:hypothetical protein